jgi:hypothetical protein
LPEGDGVSLPLLRRLAARRLHRHRRFQHLRRPELLLGETEAEILLGSLDDAPGDLTPAREGWIVRREHWLAPVAHAGQADGDPA